MILYILRHGIAEDKGPNIDDAARRLTDEGREKTREVAEAMRSLKLRFDDLLTSPLPRAAETADIVASVYGMKRKPEVVPQLAAGIPTPETVAALRPYSRRDEVLIVGHEPSLSHLASTLLTGSPGAVAFELKKSGLIGLEFPSRPEKGGGKLLFMMVPGQLRKLRNKHHSQTARMGAGER